MPIPTIIIAALLILLGLAGYLPSGAKTALIPAFVGIPLLICGLVALKDSLRKHAAHVAVIVSLLGALATLMPLVMNIQKAINGAEDFRPMALAGVVGMLVLCVVHVALSVRSFIAARKARRAAEAGEAPAPE